MGIRTRKPTSPGRRFQTCLGLRRDHGQAPGEVTARSQAEDRRAQRPGPDKQHAIAAADTSSQYRIIDFKRSKDGVTAKVRGH